MNSITPFTHTPGDILTGLQHARSFAWECSGPVTVLIAVPQGRGLSKYIAGRTFWSETFEEAINLRHKDNYEG